MDYREKRIRAEFTRTALPAVFALRVLGWIQSHKTRLMFTLPNEFRDYIFSQDVFDQFVPSQFYHDHYCEIDTIDEVEDVLFDGWERGLRYYGFNEFAAEIADAKRNGP